MTGVCVCVCLNGCVQQSHPRVGKIILCTHNKDMIIFSTNQLEYIEFVFFIKRVMHLFDYFCGWDLFVV